MSANEKDTGGKKALCSRDNRLCFAEKVVRYEIP